MENSLLNHFLPEELLYHFSIVDFKELGDVSIKEMFYEIYLEENNVVPKCRVSSDYESKGFYTEVTIQDFPIQGKAVYLKIKRRRWRHKDNPKDIIRSDYSFVAESVTQKEFCNITGTTIVCLIASQNALDIFCTI